MNKKRRTQGFNGFGLVRTKTYIATRELRLFLKKLKLFIAIIYTAATVLLK